MRIVAGDLRGREIVAPPGRETRPTGDRVREALFAIVGDVQGADVLDVFAGSGALGLEALSRGARSATLVERSPRAVAAIRRNVERLGVGDRVRVVPRDWRAALAAERAAGRRYDLCLVDPPYSLLPRIATSLGRALVPLLSPRATVVVEHARTRGGPSPLPLEIDLPIDARSTRAYGDTALTVIRLATGEAS